MSRGDRREQIFLDGVGRQDFIKTLAAACQKTNWQVPAYCLMPNHYHLVLETPKPKLVAGMAWLQSPYTIRLNHRHLGGSKGGKSELAPLHARGRSRQRGPRATEDMTNGTTGNDPSYGFYGDAGIIIKPGPISVVKTDT